MNTDHIPDTWRVETHDDGQAVYDENGVQRCGGRNSTDGKPCKRYPIKGRYRCKRHGGQVPRGTAHPQYKHGRYSQYMPESLRTRVMQLSTRDDLFDLSDNIRLIDARLSQIIERVQGGDYSSTAQDLLAKYNSAGRAFRSGEPERFAELYNELGQMIRQASDEYRTWDEAMTWNRERKQMTEAYAKITMQAEGMMSAGEVLDIVLRMAQLFLSINELKDAQDRRNRWATGVENIIDFEGKAG